MGNSNINTIRRNKDKMPSLFLSDQSLLNFLSDVKVLGNSVFYIAFIYLFTFS